MSFDSMKTAIDIQNVSKIYRIGEVLEKSESNFVGAVGKTLISPITNFKKLYRLSNFNHNETINVKHALNNISFKVEKGDVFGIVGRNGAGKSTLLKILSKITEPSEGTISLKGRVSSLLEVGTGFHPELTGRENIFLNGAILGMSRKEISEKFDQILDFSGIGNYIDTPIKRYSSGMKVRLAFSVAAHLEPEILLVDEVLAVGDMEFQQKCLGRMDKVAQSGRTILFVSHNLAAVENICNKGVLLENGQVKLIGDIKNILKEYVKPVTPLLSFQPNLSRIGNQKIIFKNVLIGSSCDFSQNTPPTTGKDLYIKCECQIKDPTEKNNIGIRIKLFNMMEQILFICDTQSQGTIIQPQSKEFSVSCHIKKLQLQPGQYKISLNLISNNQNVDLIKDAMVFEVVDGKFYSSNNTVHFKRPGLFLVDHDWIIN